MKKLFIVAAALLTLFTSQCFADSLKIGVVDMNQVFQKSSLMVTLNNDLIKKFQSRQNELISAQKNLQDDTNKLNMNAAMMSQDDRNKLQNKILSQQANVQILNASFQKDLAIAKDESMQKFMKKLTDAINRIAQAEKYDLIQQTTGVVFVNKQLDITQKVINEVK